MQYAISGATKITEKKKYDVVIVGAGIAGLYTALNISDRFSCCVIAKESVDISNSWLAQGGIAAAISRDDTTDEHLQDTLIAGAGLCDKDAVEVLVDEGPFDIGRLVELNVPFDLDELGELQITREGGHRKNRVVHAGGDATGRETVKALTHIVSGRKNITISEHTCFYDITKDAAGNVSGIIVRREDGRFELWESGSVVIATGGIGQVYKSSTNPAVATGDGLAAAIRAGAVLRNIEFIQFHPTGLWSEEEEDREFLISEAVRGEGGLLKNKKGERFMVGVHELAELAPRDIVARGIVRELEQSGESHVYIDITSKSEDFLKNRFPTIYNECLSRGINISKDFIPVCPVQHYLMGGIETNLMGQTNIPGLYACGEVAYTGVHGANRLASNSMLECLVFGRRAAEDINTKLKQRNYSGGAVLPALEVREYDGTDFMAVRREIQLLMSEYGYVVRTQSGLSHALGEITVILERLEGTYDDTPDYLETLNIATVAKTILSAALARHDSIGSHYMED